MQHSLRLIPFQSDNLRRIFYFINNLTAIGKNTDNDIKCIYNFDDGQTTYVAHEWRVLNFGQACTRVCGQMVRNIDMVTN